MKKLILNALLIVTGAINSTSLDITIEVCHNGECSSLVEKNINIAEEPLIIEAENLLIGLEMVGTTEKGIQVECSIAQEHEDGTLDVVKNSVADANFEEEVIALDSKEKVCEDTVSVKLVAHNN